MLFRSVSQSRYGRPHHDPTPDGQRNVHGRGRGFSFGETVGRMGTGKSRLAQLLPKGRPELGSLIFCPPSLGPSSPTVHPPPLWPTPALASFLHLPLSSPTPLSPNPLIFMFWGQRSNFIRQIRHVRKGVISKFKIPNPNLQKCAVEDSNL